jgi:holo-[acyl-carrier protein] synthase
MLLNPRSLVFREELKVNFIGHGVDIVEISRFKSLLERQGGHFESRFFTRLEHQIAVDSGEMRILCLAGRFAAKEAVLKALGTGWSQGIALVEVEILKLPTGGPAVSLHAQTKQISDALEIKTWLLSISHSESYAIASAIALS